ncbi:hypothetical protein [Rhodoblastus sp.]|uniref:hypothetical protein n=1 Tax=Rhodoblastus sp. TaxID=1962975 RepID=UPI003F9D7EF9
MMIVMMVVKPTGNGRPCHIANRAASDRADWSANNGAGSRSHQSFIQPFPGHRRSSGESDSEKKR